MATIDRYYFNVCTDGARQKGVDIDRLLRNSGIEPAELDDANWRGSVESMACLVQEIWEALSDEYMGYTPQPMPRGAFAFASELAVIGPTVAEGLERAIRFYSLASKDIKTHISEIHDQAIIHVEFAAPELDGTHYFSEFWMIIWHRLACWLADEVIPMLEASFDYAKPESYFEEFKYLFPCAHTFEADRRAIILDARALNCPVRRTVKDVHEMVAEAPLALMTVPASDTSLSRQVRIVLTEDLSCSSKRMAKHLGFSPDALRRHLREEGSSLSKIREYVRRDVATRELTNSTRSVEAIAAALGYAEARSFTRAFHRWTGLSPSVYRSRHGKHHYLGRQSSNEGSDSR